MIKNLTPHPINICTSDGEVVGIIESCGIARLKASTISCGEIDGIALTKTVFGSPEGLPECQKGQYYIVSQLIKSALPDRSDLLVPAEVVRDASGNIVGCKSLGI